MPPLLGIPRGLNGPALSAYETSGHGRRSAIVDASYNIPRWAQVVEYRGTTSARALFDVLKVVPVEAYAVDFMIPDPHVDDNDAYKNFAAALRLASQFRHRKGWDMVSLGEQRFRLDEQSVNDQPGFYTVANNQEEDTLFLRTQDTLPYACATFVIGHSQMPDPDKDLPF